ncbi:hypothetical protein QQF54_08530 [Lelliottia sp. V106_10]|uniref:hypothetical protein n=1 Tax=Lelliottia wanjuensis TaxID=3050585 RepID=UPI002551132C|nr:MULTISPECIES: hypothetical protein [unclassified Lelliottia]MDK9373399.1 hypothetical protein [Lelliottia sp. V106_10]MDK9600192.1 hypothetical protein [Lelliottia sp. V106_5]
MNIELIIQMLQRNGRSFCRDIAKATGHENAEVIKGLLELEQQGRVTQRNGYWSLLSAEIPAPIQAQVKRTRVRKGS